MEMPIDEKKFFSVYPWNTIQISICMKFIFYVYIYVCRMSIFILKFNERSRKA